MLTPSPLSHFPLSVKSKRLKIDIDEICDTNICFGKKQGMYLFLLLPLLPPLFIPSAPCHKIVQYIYTMIHKKGELYLSLQILREGLCCYLPCLQSNPKVKSHTWGLYGHGRNFVESFWGGDGEGRFIANSATPTPLTYPRT